MSRRRYHAGPVDQPAFWIDPVTGKVSGWIPTRPVEIHESETGEKRGSGPSLTAAMAEAR